MTTVANIESFANAVGLDIKTVWSLMNGKANDNAALTTTAQGNLILAINEVKAVADAAAGGGIVINDAATNATDAWSSNKIQAELTASEAAAATSAVNTITNGASAAYDTLLEIQTELQGDDTTMSNLLTAQAKRVAVDQAQAFTAGEQLQGCNNLDIGDPTTNFTLAYTTARDS